MKWLRVFIIFVLMAGSVAKISYAAGEERFIFSDLTATDKVTGLMWTKDGNIAEKKLAWKEAFKLIEKLNKQKYAGYSDWRLPTKEELETLVAYAKSRGYRGYNRDINKLFNKIGFKDVQAFLYWSSSTYACITTSAWFVNMGDGRVDCYFKTAAYYVWPVRAGQ